MRRVRSGSRSSYQNLLAATWRRRHLDDRWADLLIDPAAQVAELADLVDRGLVSREQFERQRRKMFEARAATDPINKEDKWTT